MSSIEIDMHQANQQAIVEEFYELLKDEEIVEAEAMLEELDDATNVDSNTYLACRNLFDAHIQASKDYAYEALVTEQQKHL